VPRASCSLYSSLRSHGVSASGRGCDRSSVPRLAGWRRTDRFTTAGAVPGAVLPPTASSRFPQAEATSVQVRGSQTVRGGDPHPGTMRSKTNRFIVPTLNNGSWFTNPGSGDGGKTPVSSKSPSRARTPIVFLNDQAMIVVQLRPGRPPHVRSPRPAPGPTRAAPESGRGLRRFGTHAAAWTTIEVTSAPGPIRVAVAVRRGHLTRQCK
jgi:hypothetical protein